MLCHGMASSAAHCKPRLVGGSLMRDDYECHRHLRTVQCLCTVHGYTHVYPQGVCSCCPPGFLSSWVWVNENDAAPIVPCSVVWGSASSCSTYTRQPFITASGDGMEKHCASLTRATTQPRETTRSVPESLHSSRPRRPRGHPDCEWRHQTCTAF